MRFHRNPPRRTAFTLVELLTVIGIISLLIGILLPSLSRARSQARRVAVAATIDAIGKGLEMFRNDFGQYPDSQRRPDPIQWTVGDTYNQYLDGAHWLARALAGHDSLGVDAGGQVMKRSNAADDRVHIDELVNLSRKGTYLEGNVFARDNDARFGQPTGDGYYVPQTNLNISRPVVYDTYGFPILYYRANSRSQVAFSQAGGYSNEAMGIYNQMDNATITGGYDGYNTNNVNVIGWDFANTGLALTGDTPNPTVTHYLGVFGTYDEVNGFSAPTQAGGGTDRRGKTFMHYLHNESALNTSQGLTLRPLNPETFILISAGEDGIFGTDDDVTNFKKAL
ncbi:MAG: hypothetical protein GXY44_11845 [Phycisphaerales bacterium]|nr:hypothetical protein [Phycisphaerales bacterium]